MLVLDGDPLSHGAVPGRMAVAAHLRPTTAGLHVAPAPAVIAAAIEKQPRAAIAFLDQTRFIRQE
jgi:hypothetical protein